MRRQRSSALFANDCYLMAARNKAEGFEIPDKELGEINGQLRGKGHARLAKMLITEMTCLGKCALAS